MKFNGIPGDISHPPKFLEDVQIVKLSSDRIMQLEEMGYRYLKL